MKLNSRTSPAMILTLLVSSVTMPSDSGAQCTFNTPAAKSAKLAVPLVRAFDACGSHNSDYKGFPACTPVIPAEYPGWCEVTGGDCSSNSDCPALGLCDSSSSNAGDLCSQDSQCFGGTCPAANMCNVPYPSAPTAYKFGPKGRCKLTAKSKVEQDCSQVEYSDGELLGLGAGPCHMTYLQSQCLDIRRADDSPVDGTNYGFALMVVLRLTVNDPDNGDVTGIDFPFTFQYDGFKDDGSFSLRTSVSELVRDLYGTTVATFPACTQLAIVDVLLKDPDGMPFARIGIPALQ